ncbi:MAG: hypothetical protein ACXVII_42195, partial [Solirubrobacteraceae bacterium]
VFVAPSAARNTIRARIACCCDADGVRNTVRNSRSSSSDSSIAAATRHEANRTAIYLLIQETNGTLH